MPRPQHHRGSGRLPVIPTDWETTHQPVATATMTATCRILPGDANTAPPVWDDALGSPVRPAQPALYEGPCRVQAMNQRVAIQRLGDTAARHMTYLVTIARGTQIPGGAIVEIATSSDPLLPAGHQLTVGEVTRGTLTFERDLMCVDDLSQPIHTEE